MRIMGLDYGSKTVGVAVSDELLMIAQGVEIVRRDSEYDVGKIVLGFPKNMNNTLGDRAEKSLEFKATLERRTGLEVIMWDERLSTVSAHKTMTEAGVRLEERGNYVDSIAAAIILQGYLDFAANRSKGQLAEN